MRIWIINHYALPPASAGGTRHFNLAKELKKKGHDVLIIASNFNHFAHDFIPSNTPYGEIDYSYAVPFIWLPVRAYKGNTLSRFLNMLDFSWRVMRNRYLRSQPPPDIIIGSSPHLFAAWGAERLAKKLKKPFLLEVRDIWPESLVDLGKFTHRHPLIKSMKWLEKYLYTRASRIISLLPNAKDYLKKYGVKEENILWLPNSVDMTSHSLTTTEKTPHSEENKFTVMYAGAHGLANDLETLLAAARILKNKKLDTAIRICLVGDGPEKNRLKAIAAQDNLASIEFLDPVPKNQVYQTLNQADAYLMLLKKSPVFRWGISPNKLFDYLLMERPIIFGVETPMNPVEICQAGMSIPPSDPAALAEAIYQLSILPASERKQMGKRGKEYVTAYHDIRKLADSLENMMKQLLL